MKWLASFLLGLSLLGAAQAQNLFLANDGTFKAPISGGVTITGPAATGNVPVATSSTAASWQNLYNIPATWTAAQTFTPIVTANGGITGVLPTGLGQAINFTLSPSGTAAANTSYGTITLNDTAIITGGFFSNGLTISQNFGGASVQGGRQALISTAALTSATAAGNANRNYIGVTGAGRAAASDNGTSPASLGTAAGAVFGGNFIGFTDSSSATSLLNVSGAEFNARLITGSSVAIKTAAQFTADSFDRVQGSVIDSMLWFSNQSASNPGWNNWAFIDASAGAFPLKNTATIFALGGAGTVAHGWDLSGVTCSIDCYKSTGFLVGPNGSIDTAGTTTPAPAAGHMVLAGTTATPTLGTNGTAAIFNSTAGGLSLQGAGSVNDTELLNKNGSAALVVPTGTQNTQHIGTISTGGTSPAINGATAFNGSTSGSRTIAVNATGTILTFGGGALSIAEGGTGDTGTAWTAFTPSFTCGTATITNNSARSKTLGKTTFIQIEFTITAIGSCTSALSFSLPNTAQSVGTFSTVETALNGTIGICRMNSGGSTSNCSKGTLASFLVNEHYVGSGVYENQ